MTLVNAVTDGSAQRCGSWLLGSNRMRRVIVSVLVVAIWAGLAFSAEQFKTVTTIDKAAWIEELKLHTAHFEQLAYHLPQELVETKSALEQRLAELA